MSIQDTARRAVLIAGGISPKQCHKRYANDLAWWSKQLTVRGFACRICHGDGSQHGMFAGAASVGTTLATRSEVAAALAWLAAAKDVAMLVASNHGSKAGLSLWGGDLLTPKQLGECLGAGQANGPTRVLVMGQCYGGVFGSLADPKTAVISASTADEQSWACESPPGPAAYDEFLYQFGTAFLGAPPDAPQPEPAVPLSLADAFAWAKAKDRRKETPTLVDPGGVIQWLFL
jgi:hypothetical protein